MTEQILLAAIVAVIAILAVAGFVRVARHRRAADTSYGAGGTSKVPPGSTGVARTTVADGGVVHVVGEEWTARSAGAVPIGAGQRVRVVGHDGLVLIVEAVPAAAGSAPAAAEGPAASSTGE